MCHSYNLFEYSDTHARYMKLIDSLMKENKMDEQLGVFTRQHSNAFLTKLSVLIEPITELDVVCHDERFKSFADAVRGSVS
jgi:hypothetical protein